MEYEDYAAELYMGAKDKFEKYIEVIKLTKAFAWNAGPHSAIESLLSNLLSSVGERSEEYYRLRKKGLSVENAVDELINGMMPPLLSEDYVSEETEAKDISLHPWHNALSPYRRRLLIYIHDESQFETFLPLVSELNRPILLLSEYEIPEGVEVPDYVEALTMEFASTHQFANSFIERNFPSLFHYFNTFDLLLKILHPEGVLLIGKKLYQERILVAVSSFYEIPFMCMSPIVSANISGNAYVNEAKHVNRILKCDYLKNATQPRLHIGCGGSTIKNWLNVDVVCASEQVKYMDAGTYFPFPDESFDAVYSEHMFEHLSVQLGINMLLESHRILKPNGIMRLATPCLEFLIDLYQHPELEINSRYITWSMETFMPELVKLYPTGKYPAMFVLNNFYRDWGHQVIYDHRGITNLLMECGFSNIRFCKQKESEHPLLQNLENREKAIPKWAAELETMIIEAHK